MARLEKNTPQKLGLRILVTGSRDWLSHGSIGQALAAVVADNPGIPLTLVSGNAGRGADHIAEEIAEAMGWALELHPAEWAGPDGKVRRGAGFARNQAMVDSGPDLCLAFIRYGSHGATHCRDAAVTAGIPTKTYTEPY